MRMTLHDKIRAIGDVEYPPDRADKHGYCRLVYICQVPRGYQEVAQQQYYYYHQRHTPYIFIDKDTNLWPKDNIILTTFNLFAGFYPNGNVCCEIILQKCFHIPIIPEIRVTRPKISSYFTVFVKTCLPAKYIGVP